VCSQLNSLSKTNEQKQEKEAESKTSTSSKETSSGSFSGSLGELSSLKLWVLTGNTAEDTKIRKNHSFSSAPNINLTKAILELCKDLNKVSDVGESLTSFRLVQLVLAYVTNFLKRYWDLAVAQLFLHRRAIMLCQERIT
jgi:hypothetical protein